MKTVIMILVALALTGCDALYSERHGYIVGERLGKSVARAHGTCEEFPGIPRSVLSDYPPEYLRGYYRGYTEGCHGKPQN